MGVVCSVTIMMCLTNFSSKPRKMPNYLSDVHYLQVRDDYSIYSVTEDRIKGATDHRNDKMGKKRNSVEGGFLFKMLNYFYSIS